MVREPKHILVVRVTVFLAAHLGNKPRAVALLNHLVKFVLVVVAVVRLAASLHLEIAFRIESVAFDCANNLC